MTKTVIFLKLFWFEIAATAVVFYLGLYDENVVGTTIGLALVVLMARRHWVRVLVRRRAAQSSRARLAAYRRTHQRVTR